MPSESPGSYSIPEPASDSSTCHVSEVERLPERRTRSLISASNGRARLQPETPVPVANPPGQPAIAYRAGDYGAFLSSMLARLGSSAYPALAKLTIRDLTRSRDSWREKSQQLQQQNHNLQRQLEQLQSQRDQAPAALAEAHEAKKK